MKIDFGKLNSKEDIQECLLKMIKNIRPYYSKGEALVTPGDQGVCYDDTTASLEGFARVLWGLGPYWAGSGRTEYLEETILGLINGSDRDGDEYWGDLCPGHQAFVEMAAIAVAIILNPDKIWDPLNKKQKEALQEWLLQINTYDNSHNNWLFFKVLVNVALRKVGADYSEEMIAKTLDEIETFYLGDGWYSDGKQKQMDYYIAFAMHFYSLIYAKECRDIDSDRCKRFIERADIFAKDFMYWFSTDGEALAFGRSLTYRFAQCAFWAAYAYAEAPGVPIGVVKGIILKNIRKWLEKPIFLSDGVLSVGYDYPNMNMAEGYNSPTSPYWAFKTFLILALPDGHEFWKISEEPFPKLDTIKSFHHPMMLIEHREDGLVQAVTSGQYPGFDPVHSAEKYAKFVYSTDFGFNVARSYHTVAQAAPDNMLAFVYEGTVFVRRKCDVVEVGENYIRSVWKPFGQICVTSKVYFEEGCVVREHTIESEVKCEAFECGYSLPINDYNKTVKIIDDNAVRLSDTFGESVVEMTVGNGKPVAFQCEANVNLRYPRVALPAVKTEVGEGKQFIRVKVFAKKNVI